MKIMNRTLLILLLAGSVVVADTTMDQLLKMGFSGAGKFINVFAGKVAKEGLATRTAISGERRATMTGRNIEVIDLGEQMIWRYAVSRKGKAKKCEATTFDEFREQMAALEQLPFFGDGPHAGEMPDDAEQAPEFEITLSFTQTDEQETHAGMTGDVFFFTATAHRPGLSVDEGGGILETTFVVGPKTDGWTEVQDWHMKWAAVIGDMFGIGESLNKVLASSPALQEVMAELQLKESELDGTFLRISTRLSTVADSRPQQQAQADDSNDGEEIPTTLGGLGARLGGAFMSKQRKESESKGPQEIFTSEIVITGLSDATDPILTLPDKCLK